MKIRPWFKLFAGDLLLDPDIDELHPEALGILLKCWCVCWRDGYLPNDPVEIARKTRMNVKKVKKWFKSVSIFFENHPENDTFLYSKRMEKERGIEIKLSESRKRGAEITNRKKRSRKEKIETVIDAERDAQRDAERPFERDVGRYAQGVGIQSTERNMYLPSVGNVSQEQATSCPASHTSEEEAKKEMLSEKNPSIHPSIHSENQTVSPTCDVKNMDGWMGGYIFDDLDEDMKGLINKNNDFIDTRVLLALIQFGLNPVFVDSLRSKCLWNTHGLWALLESVRLNSAGLRNPAGLLQMLIIGKKEAGPRLAYVLPALKTAGWEHQPEDNSPGEKILRIMQLKEAREKMIRLIPCRGNVVGFEPLAAVREG